MRLGSVHRTRTLNMICTCRLVLLIFSIMNYELCKILFIVVIINFFETHSKKFGVYIIFSAKLCCHIRTYHVQINNKKYRCTKCSEINIIQVKLEFDDMGFFFCVPMLCHLICWKWTSWCPDGKYNTTVKTYMKYLIQYHYPHNKAFVGI